MRYQLRPVAEQDREWLYELKSEVYRDVVVRQFGSWEEPVQRQMFNDRWKPDTSNIISVDGTDIGLLAVEDREDELWLAEIQLIDSERGRGLGSLIVQDLLQRARAQRKPLKLQVLHENYRARHLYERLGFSQIDATDTHYIAGRRLTRRCTRPAKWGLRPHWRAGELRR